MLVARRRASARLMAVTVFPTPPFKFMIAMVFMLLVPHFFVFLHGLHSRYLYRPVLRFTTAKRPSGCTQTTDAATLGAAADHYAWMKHPDAVAARLLAPR